MTVPITRLTKAAAKARPNETCRACRVRRLVTIAHNWSKLSSNVLRNRPASGIRMMIDSHVSVSPMVRPNPGIVLRRPALSLTMSRAPARGQSVLVNLVEDAAFAEVFLLRLRPAAEDVVDGEQFNLGKRIFIFLGDLGIAREIAIAGGDFLTLPGIPVPQVMLGHRAGASLGRDRIDHGQRRLRQDRHRR